MALRDAEDFYREQLGKGASDTGFRLDFTRTLYHLSRAQAEDAAGALGGAGDDAVRVVEQVVEVVEAQLDPARRQLLHDYSTRLFARLDCRDLARIDFRLGADGTFTGSYELTDGAVVIAAITSCTWLALAGCRCLASIS